MFWPNLRPSRPRIVGQGTTSRCIGSPELERFDVRQAMGDGKTEVARRLRRVASVRKKFVLMSPYEHDATDTLPDWNKSSGCWLG